MSKIKKQNIIPIPPQFDKSKLQSVGGFPTTETINQTVADLTQKPLVVETRNVGRPKKIPAEGRIAYNTMIREDYIVKLKIAAAQNRLSMADLIDTALRDYFEKMGY
jgi:hypothetical protein